MGPHVGWGAALHSTVPEMDASDAPTQRSNPKGPGLRRWHWTRRGRAEPALVCLEKIFPREQPQKACEQVNRSNLRVFKCHECPT